MTVDGDQAWEQAASAAFPPAGAMVRILDVSPASGDPAVSLNANEILQKVYDLTLPGGALRVVFV